MKNGYNPEFGARLVNRIIRGEILAGLSRYLLEHPEVKQIELSMDGNTVKFHSGKKSSKAA